MHSTQPHDGLRRPDLLSEITVDVSHGGTADFPRAATFRRDVPLNDFVLVWMIEGCAVWFLQDIPIEAPPGTVLLLRPGQRELVLWDETTTSRHAFVHFRMTEPAWTQWQDISWPLVHRAATGDVILPLFRHVLWLCSSESSCSHEMAADAVRHMVAGMALGVTGCQPEDASSLPEPVEKAIAHIWTCWSTGPMASVSLSELAQAADVSQGHLYRLFRMTLGYSPTEAMRLGRLDRAAVLLATGDSPIKAIATATGFSNPFHLSKAFKAVYGVSPSGFRASPERFATLPIARILLLHRLTGALDSRPRM